MSNPFILLAGKLVCGTGTSLRTNEDILRNTFTLPYPGERGIKGIVLLSNVSLDDIQNYFMTHLYQQDRATPIEYPHPAHHRVMTLISTNNHWHHILMEQENVKKLFQVFAERRFPSVNSGYYQSIHYIYRNRNGTQIKAVVFFNSEKFCKPISSINRQLLDWGNSATHFLSYTQMCGIDSSQLNEFSEMRYLRNAINFNTSNTCFMTQAIAAFVVCVGKKLITITNKMDTFSVEDNARLVEAVNSFPEHKKSRMLELHELFKHISNWIYFVSCVLEGSRFVDIKDLKHYIMCNPISLCARGDCVQEDASAILIRFLEYFTEYYSYLLNIPVPGFFDFLTIRENNPRLHFCPEVELTYTCRSCRRRAENEYRVSKNHIIIIHPSLQRFTCQRTVDLALNSLRSQFFPHLCANSECRAENGQRSRLQERDVRRCRIRPLHLDTRLLVTVGKNSRANEPVNERWHIPDKFTIGRNILDWDYLILNHSYQDDGENGHYTGIWKYNGQHFFVDDGSAPFPLPSGGLENASMHAYLFVCRVTGHISDTDADREFSTAVDNMQANEYNETFATAIDFDLQGVSNLQSTAQRELDQWTGSPTDGSLAQAIAAVQAMQIKITEIERDIEEYNNTTPENGRPPMISALTNRLNSFRETANGFNARLSSA